MLNGGQENCFPTEVLGPVYAVVFIYDKSSKRWNHFFFFFLFPCFVSESPQRSNIMQSGPDRCFLTITYLSRLSIKGERVHPLQYKQGPVHDSMRAAIADKLKLN